MVGTSQQSVFEFKGGKRERKLILLPSHISELLCCGSLLAYYLSRGHYLLLFYVDSCILMNCWWNHEMICSYLVFQKVFPISAFTKNPQNLTNSKKLLCINLWSKKFLMITCKKWWLLYFKHLACFVSWLWDELIGF